MEKAKNKYSSLVQQGKWNEESEEQQRIIALQAKIQKLEKWQSSGKDKPSNNKKKDGKTGKKDKKEVKKPDWVNKPTAAGEPETKVAADNKTYFWCANHKAWSINPKHTTATCKGLGLNKPENKNKQAGVKIVKVLTSVVNKQIQ